MPRPTPLGSAGRLQTQTWMLMNTLNRAGHVIFPWRVIKKKPSLATFVRHLEPSDRLPAKFAQTTLKWKSLRLNQRPFFFCSRAAFAHINKVRRSCSQIIKVGCERADEVRRQEGVPRHRRRHRRCCCIYLTGTNASCKSRLKLITLFTHFSSWQGQKHCNVNTLMSNPVSQPTI